MFVDAWQVAHIGINQNLLTSWELGLQLFFFICLVFLGNIIVSLGIIRLGDYFFNGVILLEFGDLYNLRLWNTECWWFTLNLKTQSTKNFKHHVGWILDHSRAGSNWNLTWWWRNILQWYWGYSETKTCDFLFVPGWRKLT